MLFTVLVSTGLVGINDGALKKGPATPTQIQKKDAETPGIPTIKYYNGAAPYKGIGLMGYNPYVILETFDNGIDTTDTGFWEAIVDGNGDGFSWDTASSVDWSSDFEFDFPNPPGAVYDDDAAGGGAPAGEDALVSKAIDFTSFSPGDTVILRFYSAFDKYGSDSAVVLVQPNVFGSWGYWDTVLVLYSDRGPGFEYVDLSEYAIADSIKLKFAYISHSWGWGWAIDDISLGKYVSDILLSEDFEGGAIPVGWTVIDSNGDGTSWTVGTTSDLSSYEPPNYGTAYAYYSDDDAGSGVPAGSEWLITPSLYIADYDELGLSYDFGFNIIDPNNEIFTVYARTFDGTNWSDWTELVSYSGADTALHEVLDITSLVPAESLQIAFVYTDLDGGWYWAVGVDNVTVFEIVPPNKDAGILALEPTGPVVTSIFTPQVIVKNFGLTQISYKVFYMATNQAGDTLYLDSLNVNYQYSGVVDTLTFSDVNATVGDTLTISAWIDIDDDNADNNSITLTQVVVPTNDLAVVSVIPYNTYGDPLFEYPIYVTISNEGYNPLATPVEVTVVDSEGNPVFVDTLLFDTLDATQSATLETAPFQPTTPMMDYTITARILITDEVSDNDTGTAYFTTHVGLTGTVVYYLQLPELGNYSLAGITRGEALGTFYFVSMNDYAVYKLTLDTVELAFTTHNFGAANDIPWGIAFDPTDTTLYITQIGINTSGTVDYLYAAKYDLSGNLLDTVDLLALTGQGYIAGMVYSPFGYFWAVGVADPSWNAMANIYKLDLHNKSVIATLPNPHANSFRGVEFYAHGANWVFLGGWNQDSTYIYDTTLSTVLDSFYTPVMADIAIYEDLDHYQGLMVVTHSSPSNVISVVSLGSVWPVGLKEGNQVRDIVFAPMNVGRGYLNAKLILPTATDVQVEIYDIRGRLVSRLYNGRMEAGEHLLSWKAPVSGVFVWNVRAGDKVFKHKSVVIK